MYKLMAGVFLFICSFLNNYGGKTEITLSDFMWVSTLWKARRNKTKTPPRKRGFFYYNLVLQQNKNGI